MAIGPITTAGIHRGLAGLLLVCCTTTTSTTAATTTSTPTATKIWPKGRLPCQHVTKHIHHLR